MSIAILIGVHDGLVLAADSASTLVVSTVPGVAAGVANVYDNANKIFNLYKGRPIGCITFGAGSVGNSSIGTIIKDIRQRLSDGQEPRFDPDKYTVQGVAEIIADSIGAECQKQSPALLLQMNIGFLVGGYSTGETLGESWSVEITAGK